MNKERRGDFWFWGAIVAVLALFAVVAFSPKKTKVQGLGVDQNLGRALPLALKFKDESGKDVLLGDYFHNKRPVILVPLFYRCQSACTLLTDGVLEVMVGLKTADAGKDYDTVMFSILPKEGPEDATARKKYLIEKYNTKRVHEGADKGIHCLTGTQESINQLCKTIGFSYKWDPKTDQVQHPTAIMICSPDGLLSKYYYGVDFVPSLVSKSLAVAQKENISERSEARFFGCWSFDPSRGVYVIRANQFLKIFGTAFVVLFFASLVYMGRKYKTPTVTDEELLGGS